MEPSQLPEGLPVVLEPDVQIDHDARSLVGGSPLRILRLSGRGMEFVAGLRSETTSSWTPAVGRLWRSLTDAGMANPAPEPRDEADIDWVVPVYDGSEPVDPTLPAGTTVVHDGGPNADELRRRCTEQGWRYIRMVDNAGPGVARSRGAADGAAPIIGFIDAGVTLDDGAIALLAGHFADPQVGAVAPRVRSGPAAGLRGLYESFRSPLDLGPRPSRVRPDARVSHVPAAVLLVRRIAFEQLDGFDADLRFGEDVDLVWRLDRAGWRVRYAPEAGAVHVPRASWRSMWQQRVGYGSAAAPLDQRHPGSAAPVRLNAWSLATWVLLAFGRGPLRATGVAFGVGSTAALARRLRGAVSDPLDTALRLGGRGTLVSGRWLAQAVGRAWLPIAVLAAVRTRRPGPLLAALVAAPTVEWAEVRPDIDPVRWVVLRTLDDAAYCTGVWKGMWVERSLGAIRPRFTGIPGLRRDEKRGESVRS